MIFEYVNENLVKIPMTILRKTRKRNSVLWKHSIRFELLRSAFFPRYSFIKTPSMGWRDLWGTGLLTASSMIAIDCRKGKYGRFRVNNCLNAVYPVNYAFELSCDCVKTEDGQATDSSVPLHWSHSLGGKANASERSNQTQGKMQPNCHGCCQNNQA